MTPAPATSNLAFSKLGDSWIIEVHGTKDPADTEWDKFMFWTNDFLTRGKVKGVVVFSDGGSPTSNQRRRLNTLLGGLAYNVAIVSDAAVARAVVNLLSVFNAGIRAFSSGELERARDHAGVPPNLQHQLVDDARRLGRELGGVRIIEKLRY